MSQALTLARPYARAAFGIARDAAGFAPWSDALGLAARVAADPQAAAPYQQRSLSALRVMDRIRWDNGILFRPQEAR